MRPEINSARWLDIRDLRGEYWRVVEDTPKNGVYLISNYGRLKRLAFSGGRYSYPDMIFRVHQSRKNGYYKCRIGDKKYYVHRLVAMAFIPPKFGCRNIDHINNDKSDNRARNLRWVTPRKNANNPITIWERDKRLGASVGKRPAVPATQIKLLAYHPAICVSKGIFTY